MISSCSLSRIVLFLLVTAVLADGLGNGIWKRIFGREKRAIAGNREIRSYLTSNVKPEESNDIVKIVTVKQSEIPKPPQNIRFRGEKPNMGPSEGRVEVFDNGSRIWGVVCGDFWTLNDGHVACREKGFQRGASRIHCGSVFGKSNWESGDFVIPSINCAGTERSLAACPQNPFYFCTGRPSGVTCNLNIGCPSGWVAFNGVCYRVFSQPLSFLKAQFACEKENGHLVHILRPEENNFLSDLLHTTYPNMTSAWTGAHYEEKLNSDGSVVRGYWTWYNCVHKLELTNLWYPGMSASSTQSKSLEGVGSIEYGYREASCMAMQRYFPVKSQVAAPTYQAYQAYPVYPTSSETAQFDAQYFWWINHSCEKRMPFICQKTIIQSRSDCYSGNGETYRGVASRTDKMSVCQVWTTAGAFINPFNTPGKGLGDHNYCRNPDGDVKPWCWTDAARGVFGYCQLEKCDAEVPSKPGPITTPSPEVPTSPGFGQGGCPSSDFHCPSLKATNPFNPCIPRAEVCSGTAQCPQQEDENVQMCKALLCKAGEFYCEMSRLCIPSSLVCDGYEDCARKEDEKNCSSLINTEQVNVNFKKEAGKRLVYPNKTFYTLSLVDCMLQCRSAQRSGGECLSFNFQPINLPQLYYTVCELVSFTTQTMPADGKNGLITDPNYNHYDLLNTCNNQFRCWSDSKCIPMPKLCNDVIDCADGSDEKTCNHVPTVFPPPKLQLSGESDKWEGVVEIRYQNEWGVLCDNNFDVNDAHVICRELGFTKAVEALPAASRRFRNINKNFLLTNLNCEGDEKKMIDCKHDDWRKHNCSPGQEAGVVCLFPRACNPTEFRCYDGSGCIPVSRVCDSINDCPDSSDETVTCQLKVALKNGKTAKSGVLYVSRGAQMGTVCDDEFDDKDAKVFCRMLGLDKRGESKARLDGRYGRGSGAILLDNLRCTGSELSVMNCPGTQWGVHNCNHNEDVAIDCEFAEEQTSTTTTTTAAPITQRPPSGVTQAPPISVPTRCGERPVAQRAMRVVGGFEATPGSYPWQAGIRMKYPGTSATSHYCGGTIISPDWILSAAHCYKKSKQSYKVRVGDWDNSESDQNEQEFEVEELLIHPNWSGTTGYDYDMALLKIQRFNGNGISYNAHVQAACLPRPGGGQPGETQICHVSGWGSTNFEYPRLLRAADVPLIPTAACVEMYGSSITPRMQCAGLRAGGVDTCQGDSGGPLVCRVDNRYTVWGATSFGDGCGLPDRSGVYAKVLSMIDWIRLKTQIQ